ncbi:hypothetical protein C8R44DRAFT_865468 [Mycena epipterygia]|nr:hypothetical protein C8R44DRAFT_865468 [Mycena epipterygia]
MPASSSLIDPALSKSDRAARREASQKYRWKNEDKLREKARLRMAARREAVKNQEDLLEGHVNRVKEHQATYRKKHADMLAFKQKRRRQEAFIAKYGREAFHERLHKEQAAADAKWMAARNGGKTQ